MTNRRATSSWEVLVYQTSQTHGPVGYEAELLAAVSLRVYVGESLFIDFQRSLDLVYAVDDDQIISLPADAFVDLSAGCVAWKPSTPANRPLMFRAVSGARSATAVVAVSGRLDRPEGPGERF